MTFKNSLKSWPLRTGIDPASSLYYILVLLDPRYFPHALSPSLSLFLFLSSPLSLSLSLSFRVSVPFYSLGIGIIKV